MKSVKTSFLARRVGKRFAVATDGRDTQRGGSVQSSPRERFVETGNPSVLRVSWVRHRRRGGGRGGQTHIIRAKMIASRGRSARHGRKTQNGSRPSKRHVEKRPGSSTWCFSLSTEFNHFYVKTFKIRIRFLYPPGRRTWPHVQHANSNSYAWAHNRFFVKKSGFRTDPNFSSICTPYRLKPALKCDFKITKMRVSRKFDSGNKLYPMSITLLSILFVYSWCKWKIAKTDYNGNQNSTVFAFGNMWLNDKTQWVRKKPYYNVQNGPTF